MAFGLFADSADHMDWISFVNTFTPEACYKNIAKSTYSPTALRLWSIVKGEWGGSCFGIAIANAIVFRNKDEFTARYPSYPEFKYPIDVTSNDPVKKI